MKTIFKYAVFTLLLSLPVAAIAQQTGTINATIQNLDNGEFIPGAIIEYYPKGMADSVRFAESRAEGAVVIPSLKYGEYTLSISFIGFETFNKDVRVNKDVVSAGVLRLKPDAKMIEEVVFTGSAIRASVQGDTIAYNADAYKVTKDASAEDLLEKMPGVTIEDGQVTAQGEVVQRVLLDGKEFFGDDVATAIKNLPAEAIAGVETYTKLSDQAEFSGVDDGEGYKALNFITKANMNRGVFGKVAASYGFDDKYLGGFNINMFKGDRRFSIVGLANNINQMDFSVDDILGEMGDSGDGRGYRGGSSRIGGRGGILTVKSLSFNYNNQWNEKFKLAGSYSFSIMDNEQMSFTDREYFMNADSIQFYNANSSSTSRNISHSISARLDYLPNSNNSFMMRPMASIQDNNSDRFSNSDVRLSTSTFEGQLVNMMESFAHRENKGYNLSNALLYRHKFGGRDGHTLMANISGSLSNRNGDNRSNSLSQYFNPDSQDDRREEIDNESKGYGLSGGLMYTMPVSEHSFLFTRYDLSYNYSDRDYSSFLWDPAYNDYLFSDSLSNIFNSGYLTNRVGPGYRYVNEKFNASFRLEYQNSLLTNDQEFPSTAQPHTSARFDNIMYSGNLRMKFNAANTLRVDISSRTSNPDINDLQDVLDVSNPQFLSQGNSSLRPTYMHNARFNYIRANVEKGRTLTFGAGGSMRTNSITNSVIRAERDNMAVKDAQGNTIVVLKQGMEYSRPVNLDGYWNINGFISYGAPLKFIRSNVNLNAGIAYSAMPGIFNEVENTTNTTSYRGGINIGSNISQNIDFWLSYNMGYNVARNAARPQANNEYLNQFAMANFKWITWGGITLQGNARYSKYTGISDDFSEEYMLLSASLGKKLFRSQRGEINIAVNDILDQNKSFSHRITESFVQNTTSNVIGRYVSINFIYQIRSFGATNAMKRNGRSDNFDRPQGGFGGSPQGGGGGRPF